MPEIFPKIVAIVPSTIASCQIGVLKPLSALAKINKIKFKAFLEGKASLSAVNDADLVVFCRNTEPAYGHLLNQAVATHKPIIYDLDDNFWDVPFESDSELARYHRLPLRIQQLEKYLIHANLIRVYSPVMEEIVCKLNSQVKLLRAGFDFDLLKKSRKRIENDKVQIVYATSRIVDTQYLIFTEAMKRILADYAGRVELTIWGCQSGELAGYPGVKFAPLIPDYDRFLREFSAAQFDIGLAPLEDTPFHRSKTNTKFRDYGACGVAGVYSNVPVYSDCVVHKKTGILVNNSADEWYQGIADLIDDRISRSAIQKSAYEEILQKYRQQVVEDEWLVEIHELLSQSTAYSLSSTTPLHSSEVLIRADFDDLAGIKFPSSSPGDRDPVGKVYLEVRTVDGVLLREASTTKGYCEEETETMGFAFKPIRNSQREEFLLKFTSVPDNQTPSNTPFWLPNSGYIQMVYGQR